MGATNTKRIASKDFTGLTQRGLKAHQLAVQYQAQLGARIPATLATTLAADINSLSAAIPAVLTTRQESKLATKTQTGVVEEGYLHVTAIRGAVLRASPPAQVRHAYGVGVKTDGDSVKHVLSALQLIVDRATSHPAEAAGFGILPQDVTAMQAEIVAIKAADQAQEAARAGAPLTTVQRNTIARRILSAVATISGAGMIAFAKSPVERALFEALMPRGR